MSSISDVSSISLNFGSMDIQNQWKQRKQNWDNLEKALNSGDIASAKQAFAVIQQDIQKVQKGGKGGSDQFQQDMENLQNALSAGDITAAQQAFSTIQQHRAQGPRPPGDVQNDQSEWKQQKQNWDNLGKALNSGDLAAAKDVFSIIQQDLQKFQQRLGNGNSGNSQFEQYMQNLQDALTSGDITVAQQVFSTIQQQGAQTGLGSNGVDYHI